MALTFVVIALTSCCTAKLVTSPAVCLEGTSIEPAPWLDCLSREPSPLNPVLCPQVGALANAVGIGGGAFYVPLFNILLGFSLKGSTALSQAACPLQRAACRYQIQLSPHMLHVIACHYAASPVSIRPRPCARVRRSSQAVPLPVSPYPWRAGTHSTQRSRCLTSTWRLCLLAHCYWACQWVRIRQPRLLCPLEGTAVLPLD